MKNMIILIFMICLMQFVTTKADRDKDAKLRADNIGVETKYLSNVLTRF